ncbi:MAG: DUF3108 domain-containing protein [FCB group bacterium]|nr:DUF3108 domain-containing protein [FCB group bacterium]
MRRLLTLIFSLLFLLSTLVSQTVPFKVGEILEYSAHFNVIPAGTASLQVLSIDTVNGVPTFHVRFEAKTSAIADRLYKIRDRIDTWLDRKNLATHKQSKRIREGSYRRKFDTIIDYSQSIAVTNGDTLSITHPVRDPYSLFYYLRTIPLSEGTVIPFTTFDSNVLTNFHVIVGGKETIFVPAGTFTSLVVKPYREGGILFKNQGAMKIWFSDDARRLPVQIHVKMKYGSMLLRLKKFNL